MSEFKKVGNGYISEWNGSPANAGTALAPKAHPADAGMPAGTIIVGTGYYLGNIPNANARNFVGDGLPIFDLAGGNIPTAAGNNSTSFIYFRNGKVDFIGQAGAINFNNCVFENCPAMSLSLLTTVFLNTFLPNASQAYFSNAAGFSYNSIFLESFIGSGLQVFHFSFLAKGKKLKYVGTSANLLNNCINGTVEISGVEYELKKLIDGTTRPDVNPLIPDIVTAAGFLGVYTTQGNFANGEKILDVLAKIVEPDSTLLRRSNANGFIGGVKAGRKIVKDSLDSDVTITTSQINTLDPSNWTIQAGNDEGYIFIILKISDNLVEIPVINFDGILAFRGALAGGSAGNNNVPDFFPTLYSPLTQGALKPNRLTFGLRSSIRTEKPANESHWDNDNLALSTDVARYYIQEWGAKPQIGNVAGVTYGNANPQFIGSTINSINARWIQVQIRLSNKRTR